MMHLVFLSLTNNFYHVSEFPEWTNEAIRKGSSDRKLKIKRVQKDWKRVI